MLAGAGEEALDGVADADADADADAELAVLLGETGADVLGEPLPGSSAPPSSGVREACGVAVLWSGGAASWSVMT
ncbi:hypothetical protein ACIHIX_34935 [Streptomyces sp. NPDC051913]|uniref:hypothetical protein n=1 Tax=Streptomyces sp. NPDC051913 TaxID=3365676 RepID=UPI0037D357E4